MDNNLEKEFENAYKEAKFNFFEITGFQKIPKLAVIAGMAIGYKLAIASIETYMEKKKGE